MGSPREITTRTGPTETPEADMTTETLSSVRAQRLEANSALMDLAGADELDEAGEAEFTKQAGLVKRLTKREAAMVAAGADEPEVVATGTTTEDTSEAAQFSKLVAGASIGEVLDAAVFDRRVTGATAELQQEVRVASTTIPLELFADSTVTSSGDAEVQETTIGQVFPSALSMSMGIDRMSAAVGVANVPVVTAPTAGPTSSVAIGTAIGDSDVTIEGKQLVPSRLQVNATMGRDELATFMGLETDVEMTLRAALASALDYQSLYASGTNGLLNHGTDPTPGSTVMTYALLLQGITDAIDGRYASMLSDLMTLLGPSTYRLGARVYRGNSDNVSGIAAASEMTGGVMSSALVMAPASDNQQGVVARGGSMHTGQVQRLWGGVEVIKDPYTLATEGQIRCTLVLMQATSMVRAGVYERVAFHLA